MINMYENPTCVGCFACANACPKNCIMMVRDSEGFMYPSVDAETCVNCMACERSCPVLTVAKKSKFDMPHAYAAFSKDDAVRLESSSGGIFFELARDVISRNGVVFGAMLDDDLNVMHWYAQTVEELSAFRKSKYVQSAIGDAYKECKRFLTEGRSVLFSGTPCQIAGLNAFLGKHYDNLITQDIICHGVPSPTVWRRYVEYREGIAESKATFASFRTKMWGSKGYSMRLGFANDLEYSEPSGRDLYLRGFVSNLFLRPSCYSCRFKGLTRESDITLADFWGIQHIAPEMDDKNGVSLVLLNSEMGVAQFNRVAPSLCVKEIDIQKAVKYNLSAINSSCKPKNRDKFMKDVFMLPFDAAINKHIPKQSIVKKVVRRIKKVLLHR